MIFLQRNPRRALASRGREKNRTGENKSIDIYWHCVYKSNMLCAV
jgi:hypothetical protein